jgi:sterol desaturase/sphingolipid hydroxylase (fatty acid hydroxylase superfamily)
MYQYLSFIIIIIIIIISFIKGIYTYIPETNPVPKEYNVAAILSLLCMVPISLVPVLLLLLLYYYYYHKLHHNVKVNPSIRCANRGIRKYVTL